MLALIPLCTRDSQTPSQFQSLICFGDDGALPGRSSLLGLLPRACCLARPRYARHACHALGFPTTANGSVSRNSASSKACFTCSKICSVIFRESRGSCTIDSAPVGSSSLSSVADSSSALFSKLLRALAPRADHCGKPCRRLKEPGGTRSSSEALTVPADSRVLALNVYCVRATTKGWKTSVEKVTAGAVSG